MTNAQQNLLNEIKNGATLTTYRNNARCVLNVGTSAGKVVNAKTVTALIESGLVTVTANEFGNVITPVVEECELTTIIANVDRRNNDMIRNAGINANSVFAAIANGSISNMTGQERQRVYELKQEFMANGHILRAEARQRILTRRGLITC